VRRWAVPGTVATALIAAGALVVGTRPVLGLPAWLGYVTAYVGVTLLIATWLLLGGAVAGGLDLGGRSGRRLLAAWATPLALGAPLYSRDVYSYVAQGRLADLGLNPYRYGPSRLGAGPYLQAVGHVWRGTRTPYGPLFVAVEAWVARLLPGVALGALGMRVVALAGVGLLVAFLPRLARQHGVPESLAWWLGLLNPLVLVHLVGGAHNDALMLGLLVAGLALAGDGRPTAGLLLCTLAAAVKVPAALGVVYVAADLLARDRRGAWRPIAASAAGFVGLTYGLGFGWGWVLAVGTPGRVHSMLSASTAIGAILARLGLGPGATSAVRLLGVAAGAVLVALLFALRTRRRPLRALAVSMLVVVVLSPVVQPWYLLWGIVLLAGVGPGSLLTVAVWTSTVLPFLVLPDGTAATDAVLLVFLALTLAVAWGSVGRRLLAASRA
jgi:alpha-1,6-mannosyltransferase